MTDQQHTDAAALPVQQTTEQERAAQAWDDVVSAASGTYAKKYGSAIRRLPMLVVTNGLAAALAFSLAKGKPSPGQQSSADNLAHTAVYGHLSTWVMSRMQPDANPVIDLMTWIRTHDSNDYRRATTEALAYTIWLKRFVEAQGLGDA